MPKRFPPFADLAAISLFAPLVMAARLHMLAMETLRPTRRGRSEAQRMISEKPAAALESAAAGQRHMLEAGMKLWSDVAAACTAFWFAAPSTAMLAATVPVRRRVRRNARRLTGY